MNTTINSRILDNKTPQQGVPFAVEVSVTNEDAFDKVIDFKSCLGTLSLDIPVIYENEPLPAKATRTFTLFLVGNHDDQERRKLQATLTLEITQPNTQITEVEYHDIYAIVNPSTYSGQFELIKVMTSPSTLTIGESAVLELTFANQGNADIFNLTMRPITLNKTMGDASFSHITLRKNQTYTKKISIKPTVIGRIEYTFHGQDVEGTVQGKTYYGTGTRGVTLVVKSKES